MATLLRELEKHLGWRVAPPGADRAEIVDAPLS